MSRSNTLAFELEALESIYENDLKVDGSKLIFSLSPLQQNKKEEIRIHVDFQVVCSEIYPNKEPELSLFNVKGLTDKNVEILYKKLRELARHKVGEVMIFDLVSCVEEFLSDNNKPGKKSGELLMLSCHEEMLLRKEQQKQEEYISEVQKKTKLMENIRETQKKLDSSDDDECSDSSEDGEERKNNFSVSCSKNEKFKSNSVIQLEEFPIAYKYKVTEYIQFNNKILRGYYMEDDTNSIRYPAIDTTTGNQLLLQEWHLKLVDKNSESMAFVEKELGRIQNCLNNLKNLCHENLVSYIDFKWNFDKGDWIVYVLQEYVTGVSLNVFIKQNVDLNINFIRQITYGVLKALHYLHSNKVVHGCLDESNVYFSTSGIKLVNYVIKKKMDYLCLFCKNGNMKILEEKMSQKTDILEIGRLLLKLMKQLSSSNKECPTSEFQELWGFIEKCSIENDEERWTANKLLNHKFLKFNENKGNAVRKKSSAGDLKIEEEEEEEEEIEKSFLSDEQHSRLAREFKILKDLGCGSFGKVLKVKKKLDSRLYAIKVIKLNIKNKQVCKKVIREVKLLSKLNHENIVRYYNSWIEADGDLEQSSLNERVDEVDSKSSFAVKKSNLLQESDDENDEDEDDDDDNDDEEEEEEDDDEEVDGTLESTKAETKCDDSSFVVFMGTNTANNLNEENENHGNSSRKPDHCVHTNKFMYIQMEFCEKSTLRIAINDMSSVKLCDDKPRFWRLFREIVEGLAYIHEQGMIHRDLKPENIFLDSCDHVKIGDFGLATLSAASNYCFPFHCVGDNDSCIILNDDFHTGKVGTSLYVAPEVDKTFEKLYYNEKVDIYSLGIIFFEMCHGPFNTNMERIDVISNLRMKEVILPQSWNEKLPKEKNLVKILLNHDPKSRPYCSEILKDNYLPPSECEYEEFQDFLRQTLSNPKSKAYKHLVSSCFDQEVRMEDDVTYQLKNVRSEKQHYILDLIKDRMENILKKHGAIYLSAPLLLPQTKHSKNVESIVKLMTHSGSIVYLPNDLRTSFARYVACKGFTRFRRYAVERVYREKKVHGLHPKEQYECAFDLITPSPGIENATLEVLTTIQEIINEFDSLKSRNCVIRLNHSHLLKAILIHLNSEKWYTDIFKALINAKESKYFKNKLEENLQQRGIQNLRVLISLLTKEDSYCNMKKELNNLVSKRAKPLDLLNETLDQLESLISKAEKNGIKVPIKIGLGVVCNLEHLDPGVMFDVVYQVKQKKKKEETVVLMNGCRYDKLISEFRDLFDLTKASHGDEVISAVGLSVHLDKIATVLKEDNVLSEYVVISSIGNNLLTKEKETMVKKLWESGIKCYIEETTQTLEELTDYCRENNINHIINLRNEENGLVILMTWDNDKNRYQEKKTNVRDIVDHISKHTTNLEGHLSPAFSRQRSESVTRSGGGDLLNGNQARNIHVVVEDKSNVSQKKKYENQLRSRSSCIVEYFTPTVRVEVVGVSLDEQKLKDVSVNFKSTDTVSSCAAAIDSISDSNSKKKYVTKIYQKLQSLLSENPNTVIILYSLLQDKYQIIIDRPLGFS